MRAWQNKCWRCLRGNSYIIGSCFIVRPVKKNHKRPRRRLPHNCMLHQKDPTRGRAKHTQTHHMLHFTIQPPPSFLLSRQNISANKSCLETKQLTSASLRLVQLHSNGVCLFSQSGAEFSALSTNGRRLQLTQAATVTW